MRKSQVNLSCDPVIENIRFDGGSDAKISECLKTLFDEDQRFASEPVDWADPERVLKELGDDFIKRADDEARHHRIEVLHFLQEGKITRAEDLYHAAMIYQHGTCADHFKLANELAERSMTLGYQPARWLYAASCDRYLLAVGRPQQFGTQLHWDKVRGWYMPALDFRTTDEERAKYDVPPIAELWGRLRNFSKGKENIHTKWQRLFYEWRAWLSNKIAQ
jgi:hypothetical protein